MWQNKMAINPDDSSEAVAYCKGRNNALEEWIDYNEQPPKFEDSRISFMCWGKWWESRTDTFRWMLFRNCYMTKKDPIVSGSPYILKGFDDNYRPMYWRLYPPPPEGVVP